MPFVNILDIPEKTSINKTLQGKSILIVGKSKVGKSTICSQAPNPVFLMTENGGENLTGFTPVPIGSWADFKAAVRQLCMPKARERFSTVVIDTYTNLILLLDKYVGEKLSNVNTTVDFGSDVEYGKGTKSMKNELGLQLQKLANQGYLLLGTVHAEDKMIFGTKESYIGTSLTPSLFGVAEKFVDQIIFITKKTENGKEIHTIHYDPDGGFSEAKGRFKPRVKSSECSYEALEKTILDSIDDDKAIVDTSGTPSVIIEQGQQIFSDLLNQFNSIVKTVLEKFPDDRDKITYCVESVIGAGNKVSNLASTQTELLSEINDLLTQQFNIQ